MSKISFCMPIPPSLALDMTSPSYISLIHPGDVVSADQVIRIYDGIIERNLPKAEWTHGAHLRAGTALIIKRGIKKAELKMPDIIRNYNIACGVKNTATDGYHHTITLSYLRIIAKFLNDSFKPPIDLGMAASAVLASEISDPKYLLGYYSRDLLFSVKARKEWQAPDLRDLS